MPARAVVPSRDVLERIWCGAGDAEAPGGPAAVAPPVLEAAEETSTALRLRPDALGPAGRVCTGRRCLDVAKS